METEFDTKIYRIQTERRIECRGKEEKKMASGIVAASSGIGGPWRE